MCGLSALCLKFLLNLYIISSFDDETMYFPFTNEQEKHRQTVNITQLILLELMLKETSLLNSISSQVQIKLRICLSV